MKSLHLFLFFIFFISCQRNETRNDIASNIIEPKTFEEKLSQAAISIIDPSIDYDPAYLNIKYPNDDVPANKGVCTDVIIRSYRKLGTVYKEKFMKI